MKKLASGFIVAFISMGAKIIPLRLYHICRRLPGGITQEIILSRHKKRHWVPALYSLPRNQPVRYLIFLQLFNYLWMNQEISFRNIFKDLNEFFHKGRPYDTTICPDPRNFRKIEFPVVFFGSCCQ